MLHNVIAMLENKITIENGIYITEYFERPFVVFRKKLAHVFDGCTDIRLNDVIRVKFDIAIRKTKEFIETELRAIEHSSLIQVVCQNLFIKSLGIGEVDFDGNVMPNHDQEEALKLAQSCSELAESEKRD